MADKIDFEKLVGGYIKYNELYYKVLEIIERHGIVVGVRANLLCPASCWNAYTTLTDCGFFIKECNLLKVELDKRKFAVVTKDEVIRFIDTMTKNGVKNYL